MRDTETVNGRRLLAKDYYVSNDTRETGRNNNDLLIGTPGTGKTGGYVYPNLMLTDHSMVVADSKGELYTACRKYLEQKGFKVYNIDFANPERSDHYNPLDFIERYSIDGEEFYREQDVLKIASVFMSGFEAADDAFWVASAKFLLASLIAFTLEVLPREEQNLIKVWEIYTDMMEELQYKSRKNLKIEYTMFESLKEEVPNSYAYKLYKMYKPYVVAEKMWSGITAFVNSALMNVLTKEMSRMVSSASDFDFGSIGNEKTVLFVNVSEVDDSCDKMASVFYTQLFQCLIKEADSNPSHRLKIPVRINLDDFGAGIKIESFDKIVSIIRSRDIYVSIVLQNLKQLERSYSKAESDTITGNCDQWIYLGGADSDTIADLAKKAGCLPETISNMDSANEWLFIRGMKARIAEKEPAYRMKSHIPGTGMQAAK